MNRSTYLNALTAAAAIPLLVIAAACGSDSSAATPTSTAAAATSSAAPSASGQPATVDLATNPSLGPILVDAQGRTLYLFEKDSGTTSQCSDACAVAWPPLVTTGQATAGMGTTGSLIGTTKRADGQTQVTYNGHPLYTFVHDQKAGDTSGEGVDAYGAKWYALSAKGDEVTTPAANSSGAATSNGTATSSSGGNGY